MIPETVTSIGNLAFAGCYSLTDAYFEGNAPLIGGNIFSGDNNLYVYYHPYTTGWSTTFAGRPTALWGNNPHILHKVVDGYAIITGYNGSENSLTIPETIEGKPVTSIGDRAFSFGHFLHITIPKSVTNIAISAFQSCTDLKSVYFLGNKPTSGTFMSMFNSKVTIYHLAGATGWDATYGGRPTAIWTPPAQLGRVSIGAQANPFAFTITGASNQVVVVEACTNLTYPAWSPVQTNTLANESFSFSDPQWTNYPARFYRLFTP
jgi:hypothetical protein